MKYLLRTITLLLVPLLFSGCGDSESDDSGNKNNGNVQPVPGVLTKYTADRSLAFPGADGGGSNVTGAAGTRNSEYAVYRVTNLNDSGTGSLRNAVSASNGVIVFTVSGQIDLKSELRITGSNLTIAGQTAPGGGITIANCPVTITGSNIILRYLRFRLGDQGKEYYTINNSKQEVTPDPDALGAKDCNNIIIDHCSMSWCIDECASFSRIKNLTMQYCIISESLNTSWHPKGSHGYGGIWGGSNASYHHNLLAHHKSRNPRFDHKYVASKTTKEGVYETYFGPIDYVNNVIYNWKDNSTYGGETDDANNTFHINMIGNYYKAGPSTASSINNRLMQLTSHCENCIANGNAAPAKIFLEGNLINDAAAAWDNIAMDGNAETRDKTELKNNAKLSSRWTTNINGVGFIEAANEAYNSVLSFAGASLKRDAIDERIVKDVKEKTGKIIDSVNDTPGYITDENFYKGTPITDTDNDGMPDSWETEQMTALGVTGKAVSEFKPSAYNLTAKYTNLEVYMNSLVVGTFPAGANAGAIK
jgi:hypothetical protein